MSALKAKKTDGSPASLIAAQTKALIMKATGQKPLEANFSTMAHVDSGSLIINALVGGTVTGDGKGLTCPGYPRRKITEIFGPESSGKTTVALSAAVQVQRQGGAVLFLDFEHAIHHGYAKSIGIKYDDSFMVFAPDTLEEGLKMIYLAINTGVDLIIVDSVAAMVPQDELDKKLDETAKIGAMAKKMSESLPKIVKWLATFPKTGTGENKKTDPDRQGTALILLNQERAQINQGHGDPTNTAGGKAIKYYASLRLRFSRIGSEIIEKKNPLTGKPQKYPYGNKTKVKVVKNKLDGTQGQDGEFFIRYGFGLDNYYSIIETGSALGVMKKEGAGYYSFGEHRIQGRDKFRAFLVANPKVYDDLCAKITAALSASSTPLKEEDLEDDDTLMEMDANFAEQESSDKESEDVIEADDAE